MMNQQPLRVMKYKLVMAPPDEFNAAIQAHLNEAWQPWGSPFLPSSGSGIAQAMVKYERKER